MAPMYDDSPEVNHNGQSLPEVYNPQRPQGPWSPQPSTVGSATYVPHTPLKHENQAAPESTEPGNKKPGRLCGCTTLVLVLSIIIAILSMAVIGLAAGTGVAASNYNDANSKLEALSASYSALQNGDATLACSATAASSATATGSGAVATSTSYSNITNGCSDKDEKTSGESYKPNFFDKPTFLMYCNKDAANTPFYSLFVADFNGCMDACAAWNSYNASDKSCEGVSFIPLWSVTEFAVEGSAPGDCYLKPGPQAKKNLTEPQIGTECHAAILES